jgi:hypothetical protein
VRVHWDGQDPLSFGTPAAANRFHPLPPPWDTTRVFYAGNSLEIGIAEAVPRWHGQIEPGESITLSEAGDLRERRVARVKTTRTLTLIDATGLGLARIEAVVCDVMKRPEHAALAASGGKFLADDIFQCGEDEYALTREWGAWFRTQCPDADGLVWVSRQFNMGRCLALFDDRCGTELELIGTPTPLYVKGSAERVIADRMIGELGWGVEP